MNLLVVISLRFLMRKAMNETAKGIIADIYYLEQYCKSFAERVKWNEVDDSDEAITARMIELAKNIHSEIKKVS